MGCDILLPMRDVFQLKAFRVLLRKHNALRWFKMRSPVVTVAAHEVLTVKWAFHTLTRFIP